MRPSFAIRLIVALLGFCSPEAPPTGDETAAVAVAVAEEGTGDAALQGAGVLLEEGGGIDSPAAGVGIEIIPPGAEIGRIVITAAVPIAKAVVLVDLEVARAEMTTTEMMGGS